jgi:hypothetical protein
VASSKRVDGDCSLAITHSREADLFSCDVVVAPIASLA